MRIERYEDAGIQGGIGAAAAFGSQPRIGWLPTTGRRQVLGGSPQFRVPLDESLPSRRRWGLGRTRSQRTPAEAHPQARTPGLGLVPAFAHQLWLSHRTVDRGTGGEVIYRKWRVKFHPRYLSQWLAERRITPQKPRFRAREQDEDEVQRWLREEWPRIKKVRRGGVHIWS